MYTLLYSPQIFSLFLPGEADSNLFIFACCLHEMFTFLSHLYTKQFVEVTMSVACTNTPLLPLLEEPILLWTQIEISKSTPAIFSLVSAILNSTSCYMLLVLSGISWWKKTTHKKELLLLMRKKYKKVDLLTLSQTKAYMLAVTRPRDRGISNYALTILIKHAFIFLFYFPLSSQIIWTWH